MTIPIQHRQSLSSIIKAAEQAIHDDLKPSCQRIFAATRVQKLCPDGAGSLTMRASWALLRSQTANNLTQLMLSELSSRRHAILIDRHGRHTALMDLLTEDRHVFGGDTIAYEPGHEPTSYDEAHLRAPQHAKFIQPVALEVINYNSNLFLNGPTEFFMPADSIHHSLFSAEYCDFPAWIVPRRENDAEDEWDDTYSALLDLAGDTNADVTKSVLIPTFWSNTVGLDFQADWQSTEAHGHITAIIGHFRIEHYTNAKRLRTKISSTKPDRC